MAASYNRVHLLGNLGQNPELRYTQSQTPVTSFSLATTEYRNSADGNKQTFTDWHRIVVWGRQAENCSKFLTKGQSVFIEGKLQTRSWEDQNGQKRSTTEVVASNVQFLRSPSAEQTLRTAEQTAEQNSVAGNNHTDSSQVDSSQANGGDVANKVESATTLDDVPF